MIKSTGVGVVINGHAHSGHRTLKLAVTQVEMNGINCFLMCSDKLGKAKSYFNSFWVVEIKNGWSLLDHGTLKLAVCQK